MYRKQVMYPFLTVDGVGEYDVECGVIGGGTTGKWWCEGILTPTNFPECDLTGLSTRKDTSSASFVIQHPHCLTSLLPVARCYTKLFTRITFFLPLSGFVETKVVAEKCKRFSILLMLLWILWLRYPNYCGANLVQCKSYNRNSDHSVGQAGAIRLAISRALLNFEDSYLEPLQQGLIITAVFKVIRNV